MRLVSWLTLLLVIILEGILTTVPLTLIFLLCLTVMKRQEWIFIPAFFAGLILDVFSFRPIGLTSMYFLSFMFLLLLYQRKYETATLPFVVISSFFGTLLYLLLIAQPSFFFQAILSTVIAGTAFIIYRLFSKPSRSDGFMRV